MDNHQSNKNILALDLGEKRIGVARASTLARLPEPLTTIANDDDWIDKLAALVKEYNVDTLVIGHPRGMQGQTTAQTEHIKKMAEQIKLKIKADIRMQDETLSSHQAEQELKARGVQYNKEAIDALAAVVILEDFLRSRPLF